jgi:hypothetical protein
MDKKWHTINIPILISMPALKSNFQTCSQIALTVTIRIKTIFFSAEPFTSTLLTTYGTVAAFFSREFAEIEK